MVSALVKRQHHMHMHMPHAHAHLARTSAHVTCDSGVVRLRVITGVSSEDLCIYGTVPRSHGIRRGSIGLKLFKVFDGDTQHITAVEPTTTCQCHRHMQTRRSPLRGPREHHELCRNKVLPIAGCPKSPKGLRGGPRQGHGLGLGCLQTHLIVGLH